MYQSPHHERVDTRGETRTAIDLEAIVTFNETIDHSWKEIATVASVSRNGVGFISPKPCEAGRLVSLVLPMPDELRAYDRTKELYAVHGLVQYCVEDNNGAEPEFNVGVALIGKKAPNSHQNNPAQTYRINGMTKKGFWTITEAGEIFKPRRFPRYLIALEVGVSLLHKETRSVVRNTAVTRDIGIGGAAVVSSLEAQVGDKVKFACEKLNFYALAVVRNRDGADNGESILRLEFIESEFPVDKLHLVKNERPGAYASSEDVVNYDELTSQIAEYSSHEYADSVEVVTV